MHMNILDRINKPNDIKDIDREDLPELADEIREFLVSQVSETGGHLAPNLGCVELTMALHRVLDFPEDKLIWDVGHQSYVHKILTGRKNEMGTLRQFGGMSGRNLHGNPYVTSLTICRTKQEKSTVLFWDIGDFLFKIKRNGRGNVCSDVLPWICWRI